MSFIQEIVLRYRGGFLRSSPMYGWGWNETDDHGNESSLDFAVVELAGPFEVRIRGFIMDRLNECIGFAGEVVDENHWLRGYWAVMTCAHVGQFDLINNPPFCMRVELYSKKYRRWPKYEMPDFPVCRCIHGEVVPSHLVHQGRTYELDREQRMPIWEQNALKRFQADHSRHRPNSERE